MKILAFYGLMAIIASIIIYPIAVFGNISIAAIASFTTFLFFKGLFDTLGHYHD